MTIMDARSLLEALGLRSVEAEVYLQLLEHGSCSIRSLATLTHRNRGLVYESLKVLMGTGLVSYVQRGQRKAYAAASPEVIKSLIDERQATLRLISTEAERILPTLLGFDRRGLGEPTVSFYQDDEGVATILRDVIATTHNLAKREYRVYSSATLRQYVYRRFPSFTAKRITKGIYVRAIAIGDGGEPAQLSERRWLSSPTAEQTSSYVIIYGDKLALISISADKTPYGVVIEEPGVAAMQRFIFDQLWATLPE